LATVTTDNFIIRYNAATTNIEMATVSGIETIQGVFGTQNGNAWKINYGPYALTTTFQVVGNPAVVAGAEGRDYMWSRTLATDTSIFNLRMTSISSLKMSMFADHR
jgi:hypothetical protein